MFHIKSLAGKVGINGDIDILVTNMLLLDTDVFLIYRYTVPEAHLKYCTVNNQYYIFHG